MKIKEIKKALNVSDKDIADGFGYANANSYRNAKGGKDRLEKGIEWLFDLMSNQPKN